MKALLEFLARVTERLRGASRRRDRQREALGRVRVSSVWCRRCGHTFATRGAFVSHVCGAGE